MDALNDGSLVPVQRAGTRRAKPADRRTLQSIVLTAIFIFGIVGVVGALMQGENTVAFLIGLFSSAIILGTVC
uniref:Uncharacterized protein n=2 Tax=unclassified Mycobacterium TaxID=2642494 RepID=A0A5Q5BFN9_MYCSS